MTSSDAFDNLLEITGKWGKFQIYNYFVLSLVVIFSVFPLCYIFTSRDTRHRCLISECENDLTNIEFTPEWLINFVPYAEGLPARCLRFSNAENRTSCIHNKTMTDALGNLHESNIVQEVGSNKNMESCDRVVFDQPDRTIASDFDIFCDENLWKLTIVGTLSVAGEFTSEIYTGYISDTYGRKKVLYMTVFLSTIVGLLKSFSANYFMYIILEYLDTALSAGKYVAAFILAMEIVGQKQRNLGNTLLCCVFAVGEVFVGFMAWWIPSWRTMLRILYLSGFPLLILIYTLPESVRWLMTDNRKDEVKAVLLKIAKTNNQDMPEEELNKLMLVLDDQKSDYEDDSTSNTNEPIKEVLLNKILFWRIVLCSFTWICCSFAYYGLTIHSVAISENIYLSFIFSAFIEIPGCIINYYANEKYGRRKMMFSTLIVGGISCIAVEFIPEELAWMKLVSYLIGKCCLTIAFAVLYVVTTEMFPTHARHRIFSICSMFGRMGMMTAPQIPLLARISKMLPMLMFGSLSLICGVLSLRLPETANTKLPDTIQESIDIGKDVRFDGKIKELDVF